MLTRSESVTQQGRYRAARAAKNRMLLRKINPLKFSFDAVIDVRQILGSYETKSTKLTVANGFKVR